MRVRLDRRVVRGRDVHDRAQAHVRYEHAHRRAAEHPLGIAQGGGERIGGELAAFSESASHGVEVVSLRVHELLSLSARSLVGLGLLAYPFAVELAGSFGEQRCGSFGGGAGGGSRGPKSRVQPGNDALLRTRSTLEEAYTGLKKKVTVDTAVLCDSCGGTGSESKAKPVTCDNCNGMGEIQEMQRSFLGNVMTTRPCPKCQGFGEVITDPCNHCAGDGRVKKRRDITVNIPAGINDGMRIRMASQGEVGHGGGPAGDLYVEVHTEEHPVFQRNADDLNLTVRVPMIDAALGTNFTIDQLNGEELTIDIEPGTQPGESIKVDGAGMPRLRTDGFGNLFAHVDVVVPKDLDRKTRESLEKIRNSRDEGARVRTTGDGQEESFFSRIRDKFRR